MNILFVTMSPLMTNNSATVRNIGLIMGLVELGHSVESLTLAPQTDAMSYDGSLTQVSTLLRKQYFIEISRSYFYLRARKSYDNLFLERAVKVARNLVKPIIDATAVFDAQVFNIGGIPALCVDLRDYDVVVSSSDPKSSHLAVEYLRRRRCQQGTRWIQYWGDPLYHDITRRQDWRNALVKYHERKLIAQADKVVYASPVTLQIQRATFPDLAHKLDYAHQSCKNYPATGALCYSLRNQQHPLVVYSGGYPSSWRNIRPLYHAALCNATFNLTICGSSDVCLEMATNVSVLGTVSYREALAVEESADILVVLCNSRGTQIPGKLYYLACMQKPVIVILDGESKEAIRSHLESFGRYILCDNESQSIVTAIEEAKQLAGQKFTVQERLRPRRLASELLK